MKNRDFIGKRAYQLAKISTDQYKQVGLVLQGKGVLRDGQKSMLMALNVE